MKTKREKSFDTVKMMREIRDKISAETQNMAFKELKKNIDSRIKASGLKPIGQNNGCYGFYPYQNSWDRIESLTFPELPLK